MFIKVGVNVVGGCIDGESVVGAVVGDVLVGVRRLGSLVGATDDGEFDTTELGTELGGVDGDTLGLLVAGVPNEGVEVVVSSDVGSRVGGTLGTLLGPALVAATVGSALGSSVMCSDGSSDVNAVGSADKLGLSVGSIVSSFVGSAETLGC